MTEKQAIFTLLGGRVIMARGRYNPTSDAVWLAALAADLNAKNVLDVGIGTGGIALCMLAHNPNLTITGIDTSTEMLVECNHNAELNNRHIELIQSDINTWHTPRTFDLVVSNPPYFKGTPANHNAHHNADIYKWTSKCIARVRPRGYFCTIVDANVASDVIAAMTRHCGDIQIFPLFSKNHTAERVMIQCRNSTHGGTTIHQGLHMNTDAILRDGLTIGTLLSRLDVQ